MVVYLCMVMVVLCMDDQESEGGVLVVLLEEVPGKLNVLLLGLVFGLSLLFLPGIPFRFSLGVKQAGSGGVDVSDLTLLVEGVDLEELIIAHLNVATSRGLDGSCCSLETHLIKICN